MIQENKVILTLSLLLLFGCKDVKKEYYDNGQLKFKAEYKDNQLDGYGKVYYENGQLKNEGYFSKGKKEGVFKEYHPNGQLAWKANYRKGKQDGVYKTYFEDGNLKTESNFNNGAQNGVLKEYYQSGALKSEQTWKDGIEQGSFKFYHPNGQLKLDAFVENDTMTVYYKEYDEKGSLIDKFRLISIEPLIDTIYVGETYEFSITPKCPPIDIMQAEIKFLIKDENEALKSDTAFKLLGKRTFNYTPRLPGIYVLKSFLMDIDTNFNTFSKEFVVLERNAI